MKLIFNRLFVAICLLANTALMANSIIIKDLVVFGDSLSDNGYSKEGGFNHYSNGPVWPEYFIKHTTIKLHDYAWGGARTDFNNYHAMNWSGLLWQIDHYSVNSKPDNTLYVIWAGVNDLADGDNSSVNSAKNIMVAVDKLIDDGAKHIVIFTLPDITLAPAYNNPKLAEYAHYSTIKNKVKNNIVHFNQQLEFFINQKKQALPASGITINLIDYYDFFNQLTTNKYYQNYLDPWSGTYEYPKYDSYMWWDAWHPMTNVHKRIADYAKQMLQKSGFVIR